MLKSFIYYFNLLLFYNFVATYEIAIMLGIIAYFLLLPPLRLIINFFTTFLLLAFKCINYLAIKLENGLYALKNYVDDPRWNASILSKILISPARLVVGLLNTTFLILLFIPLNHFGNFLKEMSVALYLPDSVSLALDCVAYLPLSINQDAKEHWKNCKELWSSGIHSAKKLNIFLRIFYYWLDYDRKDFGLGNIKKFSPEGNYRQKIISKPEDMYLATRNYFEQKQLIAYCMKSLAYPAVFGTICLFINLLFIPVRSIITVYSYILKQSYVFISSFIGEFNFEEPFSQFNTTIYLIIGFFPILFFSLIVGLFGYDREHFVMTDMFPFKDIHLQSPFSIYSWVSLIADHGFILISIFMLCNIFSKAGEIFIPLIIAPIGLLVNIYTCLYDAAFGEPNSTNTNIPNIYKSRSAYTSKMLLEPMGTNEYYQEIPNPSTNEENGATGTLHS